MLCMYINTQKHTVTVELELYVLVIHHRLGQWVLLASRQQIRTPVLYRSCCCSNDIPLYQMDTCPHALLHNGKGEHGQGRSQASAYFILKPSYTWSHPEALMQAGCSSGLCNSIAKANNSNCSCFTSAFY